MQTSAKKKTMDRVRSFLWRTAMMALAVGLTYTVGNIDMLSPFIGMLPEAVQGMATLILGLVLGEVSKAINNYYRELEPSDATDDGIMDGLFDPGPGGQIG